MFKRNFMNYMGSYGIGYKVFMETQYTDITWIVDGLLPAGLSILAGKPKAGKSCFCVDMAIRVASGEKFLGRDTHQGEVIYFSLEEDPRISKKTTRKITSLPDIPNLYYGFEFPIGNDAIVELEKLITLNPNLNLIIIDIVGCIIPYSSGDQSNKYDFISTFLDRFKKILKGTNVALLLVHHTSKKEYTLSQDKILGSTAYQAKVDSFLILEKKIGENLYILTADGKLFEGSIELFLSRNTDSSFSPIKPPLQFKSELDKLLEIINTAMKPLSPKELSVLLNKDNNIINQMVFRLFKQGSITKLGKGQYVSLDFEQRTQYYSPFNM